MEGTICVEAPARATSSWMRTDDEEDDGPEPAIDDELHALPKCGGFPAHPIEVVFVHVPRQRGCEHMVACISITSVVMTIGLLVTIMVLLRPHRY